MRFEPDSLVFGIVEPSILRHCANILREYNYFEMDDFCRALGAPKDEAMPVLEEMLKMNAIERNDISHRGPGTYKAGEALGQIASATISIGLRRVDADKLLERILHRARELNKNTDKYGRKVTKIAVFGSYLTDKELLGDIDLAIELQELNKPDYNKANWLDLERQLSKTVYSYLRLRKPEYISIHHFDELARLGTTYKVVFEA